MDDDEKVEGRAEADAGEDAVTPQRAGYAEVWMNDPSMRFRCGLKTISLVRHSGGGVRFVLVEHNEALLPAKLHKWIHITKEEQFEKIWNLLMEMEE